MTPTPSFQSYKRFRPDGAYDAIVVGSGIGGLGTAALLAKQAGRRVLVLERHYTAGGYTHAFRRPGYEWDVGVHYIGSVEPGTTVRALFDYVTDGALGWADIGEVYDRIVIGQDIYDYPRGLANLKARLKAYFPGDEAAIDGYFTAVRAAVAGSQLFFADRAMPALVSAVAGPLLRRRFLKYADRTTRQVLEGLTRNQRLIAVLTGQYGDYGLPPAESSFAMHAFVTGHYFGGGYYPVGGAGRIAAAIAPVIQAAGGAVVVDAEVAEIVVEGRRAVGVRMAADGTVLRAPVVVSDAGVGNTFGRLVPRDVAEGRGLLANLAQVRPSHGHLCLYVGLQHTAAELGLPRANYWVYPHEQHERAVAEYLANPDAPLPLAYISFPSAKDPDFERRHPGRATIEVVTLAPWAWFERWAGTRWMRRGDDYEALKAQLTGRLLDALCARVPQVRARIDHAELSTPLSTAHFAGYARGELYGLDHTPSRFRQSWLRPRTPLAGLYLTGQDISTCGVAGALFGGVLTASAITGRNVLRAVNP